MYTYMIIHESRVAVGNTIKKIIIFWKSLFIFIFITKNNVVFFNFWKSLFILFSAQIFFVFIYFSKSLFILFSAKKKMIFFIHISIMFENHSIIFNLFLLVNSPVYVCFELNTVNLDMVLCKYTTTIWQYNTGRSTNKEQSLYPFSH